MKYQRIQVMCQQGGVLLYGEAGTYDHTFLLGAASSDWLTAGGAASCSADLFYIEQTGNGNQQVTFLASTAFDAAG